MTTTMSLSLLSLLIFCLSGSTLNAQVIPPERLVNWSEAGRKDIEISAESLNVMDFGALADGKTDAGPAFQAAMDALPNGGVVHVPMGSYLIQQQLNFRNGVVLRGKCPTDSQLFFDLENRSDHCLQIQTFQYGSYQPIVSGYQKGSEQLTVDDVDVFTIGGFAEIQQENSPELMYTDERWNVAWAENAVGQLIRITGIENKTIHFTPPISLDYDGTLNPEIRSTGLMQNCGIENLNIKRLDPGDGSTIFIKNAANCWVKNIESAYTVKAHIWMTQVLNTEVKDSYFHHSYDYGGGGHGYGVVCGRHSTFCLVENNIFSTLRHAMMVKEGANGNVFGYNYSRNPVWENSVTNIPPDISLHGHYPHMNLFEGNIVQEATSADFWGPSGPGCTFFRNRVESSDLRINDASHLQNVVGNELTATSARIIVASSVQDPFLHGNNVNGTISWNDQIAARDLVPSLYLTEAPHFFDQHPFPAMGPEFTLGEGSIPARSRFEEGSYFQCSDQAPLIIKLFGEVHERHVLIHWDISDPEFEGRIILERKSLVDGEYNSLADVSKSGDYQDVHPCVGVNSYRLRLVDMNEYSKYSHEKSLIIKAAQPSLYPTITDNWVYLSNPIVTSGQSLLVFDLMKNRWQITYQNGLDVSVLPAGVYWLAIQTPNNAVEFLRFVKI